MLKARLLGAVVIVAAAYSLVGVLAAQAPESPKFEVASVKPNKSGNPLPRLGGLPPGDRVTMTNVALTMLIQAAYPGMSEIIGGPKWAGSPGSIGDADRFDVTAKAEAPSSTAQLRLMLQALLAERFKLAVHTETREEPVYALMLNRSDGRLGPQLRPEERDCESLRAPARLAGAPDPCAPKTPSPVGAISARSRPLDLLVAILRTQVDRPVVDRTGLTGSYDWDLTPPPRLNPDAPSIFTALREQLGLKLEPSTAVESVLVIDHVEHPTED